MKCDQARELILTDYMDSEPGCGLRHEVDEHLRQCVSCCEFREVAREKIIGQFASARVEDPPEFVWRGIREKITSKAGVSHGILANSAAAIRLAFSSLLSIPRPVAVLVAGVMIAILLLSAAPGMRRRALYGYLNEQITFIANLDDGEADGSDIFDTDIQIGADNFL
ncbi:MAG: hypothetical protein KKE81_02490 [Candidatus Omnitrophica bacterium]|nr:hypothetical protein [Candidatus Omnitrophota bacterium]